MFSKSYGERLIEIVNNINSLELKKELEKLLSEIKEKNILIDILLESTIINAGKPHIVSHDVLAKTNPNALGQLYDTLLEQNRDADAISKLLFKIKLHQPLDEIDQIKITSAEQIEKDQCLFVAAKFGNLHAVKLCIEKAKADVNANSYISPECKTPIEIAGYYDYSEIVTYLKQYANLPRNSLAFCTASTNGSLDNQSEEFDL